MDHSNPVGQQLPYSRGSQYDAERSNHSTGRGGGAATPNSGRGGGMAGIQGGSESQSWHRSRDEVFVPDQPPAYANQDIHQPNPSSGYYAAAAAGASYSGEGRMPKNAEASHYSNTAEVSYHSNNPYQSGYIETNTYNNPGAPHPDDVGDAFGEDDDAYAHDMAQRLEEKQQKAAKTSTIAIQTNTNDQSSSGKNATGSGKGKNADRSSQNLFVSGLPLTVNDSELRKMFDPFGTVSSAKVMLNIRTGVSRGFGFVMYSDPKEAEKALKGLHGTSPKGGQKLKITYSEHKGQNLNVESNKLYVRNIPCCSQLTNDELLNYFEKFGPISGLQCRNDPYQTNGAGGNTGGNTRSDQISSGGSSSSPTGTPGITSSGNGGSGSGTGSNQNNGSSTQNSGTGSGTGTGSRPNSAPGSTTSETESEKNRKARRGEWEKALVPSGKAGQSAMRVLFIEYETAAMAKACVDATHNSMPFLSCSTPLLAKIFEPQELRDRRLKEQSELKQRQKQGSGRSGFSGKKGRNGQQQGQQRPPPAMQTQQQPQQYATVVQQMPYVQGTPFHQPAFPQQQPQFTPQYHYPPGQASAPYIQSMPQAAHQFQQPAFVQQQQPQQYQPFSPQGGGGYPQQQMLPPQQGGYQQGGPHNGRY